MRVAVFSMASSARISPSSSRSSHGEGDGQPFEQGHHLQRGENRLDPLNGAQAAGDAAVADQPHGLVRPLVVQVVEGVLQRCGVSVVVLGHHDDKRVRGVGRGAPVLGVLVFVAAQPGVVGLVHERQVQLGQVDHVDLETTVFDRPVGEPLGHGQTDPAGTGAGDDDMQLGHEGGHSLARGTGDRVTRVQAGSGRARSPVGGLAETTRKESPPGMPSLTFDVVSNAGEPRKHTRRKPRACSATARHTA